MRNDTLNSKVHLDFERLNDTYDCVSHSFENS